MDHDFEDWLQMRRVGNRNSDYFVKYIPVAFHSYNGAITPEVAEQAFLVLQEQMLGSGIVPCRAEGNFYNEWDDLETEHPVYDNPLYYQAMQAVELAGTPATDICNIHVFSNVGDGVGGFSWINQNPVTRPWDGIYLRADQSNTSVITHEMGHYCGLYHTFNAGSCNNPESNCETQGDRVCDTPPTSANLSCEDPFCPTADYTNHMDYTPNDCRDHFTNGQILRMHALLVNGNRASVWQSGACSDPNVLDVQLLSVRNTRRCDDTFVPVVKVANFSGIDAEDVVLSVILNGQVWEDVVDVPSLSIETFEGPEMSTPYMGDYLGEAYVFLVGDQNPDNNVTTFEYNPRPHASFNVVIQHDAWPESEQWKLYKEGQVGSSFTGVNYYAAAGYSTSYPYDQVQDGFTFEPYMTHDEVCLTGGCYGGWFRHQGYAGTQELYDSDNPDYEGLICGVDVYVERGLDVDTLYSYHVTAFSDSCGLTLLCEEDNYEYMLGYIGGPSSNSWEYDYCVEDMYMELVDDFEEEPENLCLGDFNLDGDIQLQDLLMICAEMGQGGPTCVCDMDGDSWVNVDDFAMFLQVYGTDCEGSQLAPPTTRELEELGYAPIYYTMEGKRVNETEFLAQGIYLAEIEVEGVRLRIKVMR
jgi:hypothetical protein|tara:strand:+ start:5578 stop:7497 length:1920 start_codon:yes stop_codon:yes gene_type:complete